ncbi:MAG: nucleoside 2-deoxyribosyltransferase, partial [Candidatus Bathyarchaeia archaeon]
RKQTSPDSNASSSTSRHGKVLTEHSFDYTYTQEIKVDDHQIYELDTGWLKDADALVAEVSSPSLGVGYEIGRVEAMGKPILCLYKRQEGRRLSAMIGGNRKLKVVEYDREEEAMNAMDAFIDSIKET